MEAEVTPVCCACQELNATSCVYIVLELATVVPLETTGLSWELRIKPLNLSQEVVSHRMANREAKQEELEQQQSRLEQRANLSDATSVRGESLVLRM